MNQKSNGSFESEPTAPQQLARRLVKRATAPIGVIDTRRSQAHYLRLIEWLSSRFALPAQLKSRRQSGDSMLAASGVFVYRQQPPHSSYHTDTLVSKKNDTNHSDNSNRATGVVINRTQTGLPAKSSEHSTVCKTRFAKIHPVNTYSEVDTETVTINAKDNHAVINPPLPAKEEKPKSITKNSENQPLPKPEQQQTVWRLRRASIESISGHDHSDITRTHDFRSTAIKKNDNFSIEASQPDSDQYFVSKQRKSATQAADTANAWPEKNQILKETIQANQKDTLPNVSTPETKMISHSKSASIYSRALIDKELPLDYASPHPQAAKKAWQITTATNTRADPVYATNYERLSTPKQSPAASDTPLIRQQLRNSTLSFLRQRKNDIADPTTAQVYDNIPELALRREGRSRSEFSTIESSWQQQKNKMDSPDKQAFMPELEHTHDRLSKREWTQLIDRVSRVIWNKLIIDLDRRGIRIWR
ncbi:hypothetical protein W03_10430 [Nitrosomonas sp. PY1]|uniref:hypothetical protein n=1 Tax=Nitrosomonas sp. PY1 TaxID=1803906 RepID=UPI001FC819D3|nr:hypothetical protein [Nitrosomonas sp. PY1]GKS69039.1 hypothetical protein W03_10430 [Nitrosomonas sp. PY1]